MTASHRVVVGLVLLALVWVLACMVRAPARDRELSPATCPGCDAVIYKEDRDG